MWQTLTYLTMTMKVEVSGPSLEDPENKIFLKLNIYKDHTTSKAKTKLVLDLIILA